MSLRPEPEDVVQSSARVRWRIQNWNWKSIFPTVLLSNVSNLYTPINPLLYFSFFFFSPCSVYRICILNYEVRKNLYWTNGCVWNLNCTYCKNQKADKCKKKKKKEIIIKYIQLKNGEVFEARLSDRGERKKKYNSTNLYQWMIN